MISDARSLLTFLSVPVLVGDPEGRAVYANPAFERCFGPVGESFTGTPLASLFDGGGREAALRAAAEVCECGREARFRVRLREVACVVAASPITADGTIVGFAMVLNREEAGAERLFALQRDMQKPIEELGSCLRALASEIDGARSDLRQRRIEEGQRALDRIRGWCDGLVNAATGDSPPRGEGGTRFDPLALVQDVTETLRPVAEAAGAMIELLVSSDLPPLRGDADPLRDALLGSLRERIAASGSGAIFTVSAKTLGDGSRACVLLSYTEVSGSDSPSPARSPEHTSAILSRAVRGLGGTLAYTSDPGVGATTSIRLPLCL